MRNLGLSQPASAAPRRLNSQTGPVIDSLSREIAIAAATGDRRLQFLNAMKMLGNIRDHLVAPLSDEAERLLDDTIQALLRRERDLPADWRSA